MMIRIICLPPLVFTAFFLWGRRKKYLDLERKRNELRGALSPGTDLTEGHSTPIRFLGRLVKTIFNRAERYRFAARIKERAERLGRGTWEKLIAYWFWGSLLLFLSVTALFQSLTLGVITIFLSPFLPLPLLNYWERQQRKKMREEVRHSITLVSGTLRAGLSLISSFEETLSEIQEPLSGRIRSFLDSVRMGTPVYEGLAHLGASVKDPDLDFLLAALITGRSEGGALVRVMSVLEETVRERIELEEEIRVLTGQGRTSGMIVAALPILFLMILFFVSRESVAVLTTTPIGLLILTAGAILELLGFLWIRSITRGIQEEE